MKTTLPVLVAVSAVAGLALATEAPPVSTTNATTNGDIGDDLACKQNTDKPNVASWYYNSRADGPYKCKEDGDGGWSMMNAYRSGGTENVHWKYTNDVNDPACLKDWAYYTADGQTVIIIVAGRTTMVNESRRWCALPVYRSGGIQDKQWTECWCDWGP